MDDDHCKHVYTIPQFTGTCWFNSLLMALFYSELSRNFFLKHLRDISPEVKQKKKQFYKIIDHIVRRTYIKNDKYIDEFQDALKPENILSDLYAINPKVLYFNPNDGLGPGFTAVAYLPQLFEYMNLKAHVYFLDTPFNEEGLSFSNKNQKLSLKTVNSG